LPRDCFVFSLTSPSVGDEQDKNREREESESNNTEQGKELKPTSEAHGNNKSESKDSVIDKKNDVVSSKKESDFSSEEFISFIREASKVFRQRYDNMNKAAIRKLLYGLGNPLYDELYMAHDDTLFHNGKNGFIITDKGFYCRGMFENVTSHVSFSDIRNSKQIVKQNPGEIYVDGKKVIYYATNKDAVQYLFEVIKKIASFSCSDKTNSNQTESEVSKKEYEAKTGETHNTQENIEENIQNTFSSYDRVKAIKYYREQTGVGLKEAKDAVDSIFNKERSGSPTSVSNKPETNDSNETMFCPFCGKKIKRMSKFCIYCGKANNYGGKS